MITKKKNQINTMSELSKLRSAKVHVSLTPSAMSLTSAPLERRTSLIYECWVQLSERGMFAPSMLLEMEKVDRRQWPEILSFFFNYLSYYHRYFFFALITSVIYPIRVSSLTIVKSTNDLDLIDNYSVLAGSNILQTSFADQ